MSKWEAIEWIMVFIMGSLCFSLLVAVVGHAIRGTSMDAEQGERVQGIILAMLAIVSLWVGSKVGVGRNKPPPDDTGAQ